MDYKMDESIQQENRRHRMDQYKGNHLPWNLVPQQNSFTVSTKFNMLYADRDSAIEERDLALSEKKAAIEERNLAIQQRDVAFSERDKAIKERDNALAALQFQEKTMMGPTIDSETTKVKRTKSVSVSVPTKSKKKKKMGEDLNKNVTTDGSKAEWDAQDFSTLTLITFDESIMPVPVCSCTGVPRHCYKWGNGGWQSSCCTTSLSQYPLPQLPHKRHARIGGRKMSGSVFTRLLTRLGAAGHDLSMAVDLKNYWAKHGTNRYITIK